MASPRGVEIAATTSDFIVEMGFVNRNFMSKESDTKLAYERALHELQAFRADKVGARVSWLRKFREGDEARLHCDYRVAAYKALADFDPNKRASQGNPYIHIFFLYQQMVEDVKDQASPLYKALRELFQKNKFLRDDITRAVSFKGEQYYQYEHTLYTKKEIAEIQAVRATLLPFVAAFKAKDLEAELVVYNQKVQADIAKWKALDPEYVALEADIIARWKALNSDHVGLDAKTKAAAPALVITTPTAASAGVGALPSVRILAASMIKVVGKADVGTAEGVVASAPTLACFQSKS